jgi:hypothetical protein
MNKENIKNIVKYLNNLDYKELIASIILFEKLDYLQDIEDLTDDDIKTLDKIYQKFMDSNTITGLLNEEIQNIIDEILEDKNNE